MNLNFWRHNLLYSYSNFDVQNLNLCLTCEYLTNIIHKIVLKLSYETVINSAFIEKKFMKIGQK